LKSVEEPLNLIRRISQEIYPKLQKSSTTSYKISLSIDYRNLTEVLMR